MKAISLDQSIPQEEFAALVGVSPARVSQLVAEGTLPRGADVGSWLLEYCRALRETAAGRDPNGDLARKRAEVAEETRRKLKLANDVADGSYMQVDVLEAALTQVARKLAARLDALVPIVRRRMPDLPSAVLHHLAAEIAACREELASVSLDDGVRATGGSGDDGDEDPLAD